jgi:DNA invertase Pin-like site-specific DNA recombinase
METRFIAYLRTSTPHPYSLEVQRQTIEGYAARIGGTIIARFEEVRLASLSFRSLERAQPELAKALEVARRAKATVIVARLDRLTRSVAILANILESNQPLVVAETPGATPFVLQIYAAAAEEYRRQTSRRCKAGIAAAIASGVNRRRHAHVAAAGQHKAAKAHALRVKAIIEEIRLRRPMSAGDVAEQMNRRSELSYRKLPWTASSILVAWRWFHRKWATARYPGRPSSSGADEVVAARAKAEQLRPIIELYYRNGALTPREFTTRLNEDGVPTVTGVPWRDGHTRTLLRRLGSLKGRPI